jgi:hypothetical protein
MANPVQVLERLTMVAPLGLRFHDVTTGASIGSGLSVTIYPANNRARRVEAFVNRSGTYVLHHAPGLRAFEQGAGDEDFWTHLQPPQPFIVEVVDLERRFQPFSFEAELPSARGLFNWLSPFEPSPPSPPSATKSIPLYSAPARTLDSGMAVIRADLWNSQANRPAAWAVLEARLGGVLQARGISDERGSIALIFPYPKPTDAPLSSPVESPPVNKNVPLLEQTWELTLDAGYAPASPATTTPSLPDLRATLDQLNAPPAKLWIDFAAQEELASVTLRYGQELILKSQDSDTVSPPAPQSVLFITPAGSPP